MQIPAKNSSTAAAKDVMASIGTCRQPCCHLLNISRKLGYISLVMWYPKVTLQGHWGCYFSHWSAKGKGTWRGREISR